MRVALSLLTLDPRIAGGAETYVGELCAALGRVGEHEYEALVPALAPDAASGIPSLVAAGRDASRGRARLLAGLALRGGTASARLDEAEVVHYPVTVPVPRTRRPRVVTLHDLQHRDLPELFSREVRAFRRLAYDRSARTATRVIVVSEWVRARAIEMLGLDPAVVAVVHHGVDLARFCPDPAVEREPFLLYPARPWPHKNHARLLEAFALLRSERPELRLVLTGGGHDTAAPVPDGVEVRGAVAIDELVGLYRRAAALVFPSLHEGFGLPVLEAMACGCPVAAARAGALPEVVGGAGVLFDPRDPQAIAEGVLTALAAADRLSDEGSAHAGGFTWDASARAHDAVYRAAAADESRRGEAA